MSIAPSEADLLACCAAPAWVRAVASGCPYPDLPALQAAGAAAVTDLTWPQVRQALAAHPRIGQRPDGAGREAAWSRREQAGTEGAPDPVRAALVEANRRYEERFGHVFLICATGRSAEEMLAQCRARLANDDATEQEVVRRELARIVALRLARLA